MRVSAVWLVLLAASATAAEIATWEAGEPIRSNGLSLARGKLADYAIRKEGNRHFAVIVPGNDHFRRAAFLIRVEKRPPGDAWLTAEYLDRGYALISISPQVPQTDQWGVARLNTGKLRRAVFRLAGPALDHPLRIFGIENLRALRLADAPPASEPVPHVAPAVALHKSIQLVTSAGADTPTLEELPRALASLCNQLPLVRALGFEGVESYVKWNFVERSQGVFDWSYYDAVVAEVEKHGLKWFPLLVAGPSYTLPDWYYNSAENVGYVCLEHRIGNSIQTIFTGNMDKYVRRFLAEFGKHYASRPVLLGVRLGVSGTYGETQYPASGNWGYQGKFIHSHLGYWVADRFAVLDFRKWLASRYGDISKLNAAWTDQLDSFDRVETFLPITETPPRKVLDFTGWYLEAMNKFSDKWAHWAREAMPSTPIYQSCGGSGEIEVGTDFTFNSASMAGIKGGLRVTNEGDLYAENFAITRLSSSATRFYGAAYGLEPAGFGTVRGVTARLYNALTTGAEHLFYYGGNLFGNDQAIGAWLRYASLLDRRAHPMIDIALFYPETQFKLQETSHRALLGRARQMRAVTDFDYVSEQMVVDGALDRYRVL
ncbi:MAG: beta-galactosidase, partial [Acidobacteria bacterium]|nr:beta-galactosidase [Acidobacteriota bacterium]